MSKQAMELALEALVGILPDAKENDYGGADIGERLAKADSAVAAIKEAIRQHDADRFFFDHGLWHDRVTGQHMYTQDQYDQLRREAFHAGYVPEQHDALALTAREVELIDGMIQVQLYHASQCDRIGNRVMAEKQKGWDMERVALLRKIKEQADVGL